MKIERLYAITVYLLNHGRTSASELAKYFEVSVRTIQRDMDSLDLAGIPVIAVAGASGGYEIAEQFRLNGQFATPDDYSYILTALQGLVSVTNDQKAKSALEKVACASKSNNNGILLDFSVLREGDTEILQSLQSAVLEKRVAEFTYTNNDGVTRTHSVEPVAVMYRWYAWYLLAYSRAKDDYRTYKLVRMRDLKIMDSSFSKEHESASVILESADRKDSRRYLSVLVKCKDAAKLHAIEYLRGVVVSELTDGGVLMKLTVVENEQLWFGTLLSMGDEIEVIEPEELRERLADTSEKILSLYKKL